MSNAQQWCDTTIPIPAYVNGCADGLLIEACAGLLDGDDPQTCIRREAEEDGFVVRSPRKVLEAT